MVRIFGEDDDDFLAFWSETPRPIPNGIPRRRTPRRRPIPTNITSFPTLGSGGSKGLSYIEVAGVGGERGRGARQKKVEQS